MPKPMKPLAGQASAPGRHFVKGQSGNPGGRPKTKLLTEALKKELAKLAKLGDEKKAQRGYERLAQKLLAAAYAGDTRAIEIVFDRVEGKVPQPLAGDPEAPLTVRINIG